LSRTPQEIEKLRAKIENLNDLLRLARDIRIALDFKLRVLEAEGIVDLIIFSTEERIFTKLTAEDIDVIDERIAEMIENLIGKAVKLKQ